METVLVVDTRAHRKLLRNLLLSAGYQVEFAPVNGNMGAILGSSSPAAVVLTWMSGKNIPEAACLSVRRACKTVPILVLGPKTNSSLKVRLFESGADDFLEEPCDDRELVARLKALIRRSRFSAKASS